MSTSTKGKTVRTKNSHSIKVEASDILSQNRTLLAVLLLLLGLYANINHYEKEEKKGKDPSLWLQTQNSAKNWIFPFTKKFPRPEKEKSFSLANAIVVMPR